MWVDTRHRPQHTPRLWLKPKAPHSGYVDGAWWPHSDDLTTELPDLLAVLSVRLGRIDRVLYKLYDWAKAPARLATGGRAVRLDGYRLQPPNTVESPRTQRQQDRFAGGPARLRTGRVHATRRPRRRGQRLDRRWPAHDQLRDRESVHIELPRKNAGTLKAKPCDSLSASTTPRPACPPGLTACFVHRR